MILMNICDAKDLSIVFESRLKFSSLFCPVTPEQIAVQYLASNVVMSLLPICQNVKREFSKAI